MSQIAFAFLLFFGVSSAKPSPDGPLGPQSIANVAHPVTLFAWRDAANSSAADAAAAGKPKVRWARKKVHLKKIDALKAAASARAAHQFASDDDWADWVRPAKKSSSVKAAPPSVPAKTVYRAVAPTGVPLPKPALKATAPPVAAHVTVSPLLPSPKSAQAAVAAGRLAGVAPSTTKVDAKRGAVKEQARASSEGTAAVVQATSEQSQPGAKEKAVADALRREVENLRKEDDGIPAALQKGRH